MSGPAARPPGGRSGIGSPRGNHYRPSHRDFVRRRIVAASAALVLVGLVVVALQGTGSSSSKRPAHQASVAAKPSLPPRLEVVVTSWQLPEPLSRTIALAFHGDINLLGGLSGTGTTTTSAVYSVNPTTGTTQTVGTLPVPVHDSAGAVIGAREFVFGGGSTTLTDDVQAFSLRSQRGKSPTSVAGHLPARRADLASAVAPDGTVYLVGGYDGSSPSPDVLATRNGTSFSVAGRLPVTVRYPAAAVSGGRLWVIGGQTSTGADSDAIQAINLKTHAAVVAGHLPEGLSHAVAAILDGSVYIFGGRSGGHVVDTVFKLDPSNASVIQAGSLPIPTSDMAAVTVGQNLYLLGGEGQLGLPSRTVMLARMVSGGPQAASATGGPPFSGDLLIADRGNNRLLLVTPGKRVLWTFPGPGHPAPAQGFYFPDDAFFVKHGTAILTNEEDQNTILELAYPSGQVIASYGHPNQPGSAPGYLDQPDDAYLLPNGMITVADAKNCRILILNPNFTYHSSIGHTGRCHHDIPNDVAYPNGDTPLQDGNLLVSEIFGSYVDEVTLSGQVVWSVKLPIAYPSDPQQIGPDLYLIADYSRPGGIYEFTREGQIVWSYKVDSGEGMLDHPSLAEKLPSGLICANDDYRDRVVCIDPTTKRIVWQYGDTGAPGTAPGLLNTPDGFDLLAPDGTTPTHPFTG